jgi:hypothetical protein
MENQYQVDSVENEHLKNVRLLMIKMRSHLSQLSTITLPNFSSITSSVTFTKDESSDALISALESSFNHQNRINRLSLNLHNFHFTVNFWNLLGNMALLVIFYEF